MKISYVTSFAQQKFYRKQLCHTKILVHRRDLRAGVINKKLILFIFQVKNILFIANACLQTFSNGIFL